MFTSFHLWSYTLCPFNYLPLFFSEAHLAPSIGGCIYASAESIRYHLSCFYAAAAERDGIKHSVLQGERPSTKRRASSRTLKKMSQICSFLNGAVSWENWGYNGGCTGTVRSGPPIRLFPCQVLSNSSNCLGGGIWLNYRRIWLFLCSITFVFFKKTDFMLRISQVS